VEITSAEWIALAEAIQHYGATCRANRDQAAEEAWTAIVRQVVPQVDGHPRNILRDLREQDAADAFFVRRLTTSRVDPAVLLVACVEGAIAAAEPELLRPRIGGYLRAYHLTSGRRDRVLRPDEAGTSLPLPR
jgi:hypothetical protein